MTEEIVAWGWEQWWGHCDTNDLVQLLLPVMITGIGLGDNDLMHDDGKHGAYLFVHCDVSPLYLHYGLRANSVWSWPSVHNPSSMLYLVFASQLQYFTLPPLVRADSTRTLLGLFRVVMLYIILIGFLSWIWKLPLRSHLTYHIWNIYHFDRIFELNLKIIPV